MPAATRIGDLCSGHAKAAPRPSIQGSSNVFVNGIGVHREDDGWAIHFGHSGTLAMGSSTVYVNGKSAGRIGDPITCGSVVAQGSSNVFIGG